MKRDIQRIMLATAVPLFLIFILFLLKIVEVGMDWDFSHMGIYPLEKRGITGILTHPLIHSGFSHLLANTLPLFFLSWCLFYFYRGIAGRIFMIIWIGAGLLTFIIGKPGWHIGASGLIYGLAFFLFFSGILRKYIPLIAISPFCMEESSGICSPTSLPPTCHGKDISAEESWEHSVHSVS